MQPQLGLATRVVSVEILGFWGYIIQAQALHGDMTQAQIIHGDCLELMKAIPDNSVDMIWTDPPYGNNNNNGDLIHRWEVALGKSCDESDARPIYNDSQEGMELALRGMLKQAGRILCKDCCCCCCGGGGPTPTFARVAMWLDEKPMQFFHAVVWDKGGLGMGWRYRRNYEFVMIAHRRGGRLSWAHEGCGTETANVVRIGKIIPSKEEHPTPKPVELIEHFLRLHTQPGDLVLDPFCGSGPVGVACVRMGRRFIGFELDLHWAMVARERIRAAQEGISVIDFKLGQSTLFESLGI